VHVPHRPRFLLRKARQRTEGAGEGDPAGAPPVSGYEKLGARPGGAPHSRAGGSDRRRAEVPGAEGEVRGAKSAIRKALFILWMREKMSSAPSLE